jgi:hypothetical protein
VLVNNINVLLRSSYKLDRAIIIGNVSGGVDPKPNSVRLYFASHLRQGDKKIRYVWTHFVTSSSCIIGKTGTYAGQAP